MFCIPGMLPDHAQSHRRLWLSSSVEHGLRGERQTEATTDLWLRICTLLLLPVLIYDVFLRSQRLCRNSRDLAKLTDYIHCHSSFGAAGTTGMMIGRQKGGSKPVAVGLMRGLPPGAAAGLCLPWVVPLARFRHHRLRFHHPQLAFPAEICPPPKGPSIQLYLKFRRIDVATYISRSEKHRAGSTLRGASSVGAWGSCCLSSSSPHSFWSTT